MRDWTQWVVACEVRGYAAHAKWVRGRLLAAAGLLGLSGGELTVVFVNDARMAELHERFSGVPGTTDVLTFNLSEKKGFNPFSGEVYVCVDEAKRRSVELGHPLRNELLLYALHGLLHLLGYDDHRAKDYRAMHEEEDRILKAMGVGPVFKPAKRAAKPPIHRDGKAGKGCG